MILEHLPIILSELNTETFQRFIMKSIEIFDCPPSAVCRLKFPLSRKVIQTPFVLQKRNEKGQQGNTRKKTKKERKRQKYKDRYGKAKPVRSLSYMRMCQNKIYPNLIRNLYALSFYYR